MEEKRKNMKLYTCAIFVLATIVGVNLVFTGTLWQAYESTKFDYESMMINFRDLMNRIQATSQYVTVGNVTLRFQPYMPTQTVSGTIITYLLGFVTVSNLTNIIARPLTLTVTFEPDVTYPDWGNVTYEYTNVQILEIPPGLDDVLMPWGAFPVMLQGFHKGDVINWDMTVTAYAEWMGIEVARVSLMVTFKLIAV